MAKRQIPVNDQSQEGSVEVIYVKMTGSNQTISDAIRQVTSVIRQSHLPLSSALAHAPKQLGHDASDNEVIVEDEEADPAQMAPATQSEGSANPSPRRKPRKPDIVEDIDLQSGDMPFEEYVEQMNPQSQIEKVLVTAGWYTEHGKVEEISIDHIYTGFKSMNWTDAPKDYRVPLSDLEHKKEFLSKGSRGTWKLNHVGENELRKMKERAAAQAS